MVDKFEDGKTYRLVDVEGYLSANTLNKGMYEKFFKSLYCFTIGKGGFYVRGGGLQNAKNTSCFNIVSPSEVKYFEEVTKDTTQRKFTKGDLLTPKAPNVNGICKLVQYLDDGCLLLEPKEAHTLIKKVFISEEDHWKLYKKPHTEVMEDLIIDKWRAKGIDFAHDDLLNLTAEGVISVILDNPQDFKDLLEGYINDSNE